MTDKNKVKIKKIEKERKPNSNMATNIIITYIRDGKKRKEIFVGEEFEEIEDNGKPQYINRLKRSIKENIESEKRKERQRKEKNEKSEDRTERLKKYEDKELEIQKNKNLESEK